MIQSAAFGRFVFLVCSIIKGIEALPQLPSNVQPFASEDFSPAGRLNNSTISQIDQLTNLSTHVPSVSMPIIEREEYTVANILYGGQIFGYNCFYRTLAAAMDYAYYHQGNPRRSFLPPNFCGIRLAFLLLTPGGFIEMVSTEPDSFSEYSRLLTVWVIGHDRRLCPSDLGFHGRIRLSISRM